MLLHSSAETAGLSVNDEIIGINGFRVDAAELDGIFNSFNVGDEVSMLVAREDILLELKATITSYERPSFKLSIDTSKKNDLLEYWMR